MRRGVQRSKTVLADRGEGRALVFCVRAGLAGTWLVTTAVCKSCRAGELVRADSRTGQSKVPLAEIVMVSAAGSCEGQCDAPAAAGARHVISHHARRGAALPSSRAHASTNDRFTDPV